MAKNETNLSQGPTTSRVKVCQLAVGLDLIGSKMSLVSGKNYELEATGIGIRVHSKSTGRVIVIPYSNVKGFEFVVDKEPNAK